MMDCVWMLGGGSQVGDWELRYSLRSAWTHYRDMGRVWVIGHRPSWLNTAALNWIPWPDPYGRNKDANLIQKVLRMAMEPTLSERFLVWSDDHFLLRPADDASFRPYHEEDLAKMEKPSDEGSWRFRLWRTGQTLRQRGCMARNFDGHIPYPVRKSFAPVLLAFDYGATPGMTLFTLYFNATPDGREGVPISSSRIRASIRDVDDAEAARKLGLGNLFACVDDRTVKSPWVRNYFERAYPVPSPFEL